MFHVEILKERKKERKKEDLVVYRIREGLSQFDQLLVGSLKTTLDVLLDVRENVVDVSCQELFVLFCLSEWINTRQKRNKRKNQTLLHLRLRKRAPALPRRGL